LLKSVLVDDYGLGNAIGDTVLAHATFISADGRTIAGIVGTGGTGWVVTLPGPVPEPSSLMLLITAIMFSCVSAIRKQLATWPCR
jgi:hypothetical protein